MLLNNLERHKHSIGPLDWHIMVFNCIFLHSLVQGCVILLKTKAYLALSHQKDVLFQNWMTDAHFYQMLAGLKEIKFFRVRCWLPVCINLLLPYWQLLHCWVIILCSTQRVKVRYVVLGIFSGQTSLM